MRGFWDGRAWLLWALAGVLAVLFAWLDYAGHLGSPAVDDEEQEISTESVDNNAEVTEEDDVATEDQVTTEEQVTREDWVEFEVTNN